MLNFKNIFTSNSYQQIFLTFNKLSININGSQSGQYECHSVWRSLRSVRVLEQACAFVEGITIFTDTKVKVKKAQ